MKEKNKFDNLILCKMIGLKVAYTIGHCKKCIYRKNCKISDLKVVRLTNHLN